MTASCDPMHILFVNPHLTSYRTEAGTWARQLAGDLRSTPARVTTIPEYVDERNLVAADAGGGVRRMRKSIIGHLPKNLAGLLIEFGLLTKAVRNTTRCCWSAWRKRKELSSSVVLYARTYEYDWTPRLVASILKCPVVLEVHSPFYLERRFRGRRESTLVKWFDNAQWRRAAHIRVVSKPVEKLLANDGVNPDRIHFIPYGLDALQPVDAGKRPAGAILQIIFVGSFYPWHGVEKLLEAFALTRPKENNLRLCLVGDGMTRLSCEGRALALGIQDSIEFTGWLPRTAVAQRLREADVAVAPFLDLESFYFDPVKVLEYMAAGLAIIASDLERISEMLAGGRAGLLVPPGDVQALGDSIVRLVEDAPLRRQLGEAARNIIEQGYSRKIIAQRVQKLCREAAVTV